MPFELSFQAAEKSSLSEGGLSFIKAHRAATTTEQSVYFHKFVESLEDYFRLCAYTFGSRDEPPWVMISSWQMVAHLVKN